MSLKTDNFKLYKYEDNDIGDLRFINDSMDLIDKGISPFYAATESATNTYKVTTGANKTILQNGYSIRVAIPKNSTGAVKIAVDSVTVPVKKPNGNAVTNFKQNGVYSLTYYNSVFILASGGVDDVNFSASDLLTGKSANDSNGEKINGTMPNKGISTNTLGLNGSLTLPSGYYDSIKVTQSITTKGATTNAISQGANGDYIYTRIPQGAYFTNASFGYPEIKSKFADIASVIGLTADKLVAGNTIGGISGTATVESLGGIPILYSVTMNGIANGYTFPYTTAPDVNYVVIIMKDNTNSKVYITSRYATTNYPSYFYTQTTVTNDLFKSDYSISGYMNTGGLKFKGNISGNVTITVIKFM